MKIRLVIASIALLFALGQSGSVDASVVGQWGAGKLNLVSDNNADLLLDLVSTVPGQLDIGDGLLAIISFNTVEYAGGLPIDGFFGVPGFNEFTGVAVIQVTGKTPLAGPPGTTFDYTFSAPSAAVLAAATAAVVGNASAAAAIAGFIPSVTTARLFDGGLPLDFDREAATIGAAVASAVNGTHLMDIGFAPAIPGGSPAFWTANDVASDNVTAIGSIPLPATGGGFNFGQYIVPGTNDTGFLFSLVPTFNAVTGAVGLHQFGGTGNLLGTAGASTQFDAYSDTNMVFQPEAVPEPLSLIVWGGLISISCSMFVRRCRS